MRETRRMTMAQATRPARLSRVVLSCLVLAAPGAAAAAPLPPSTADGDKLVRELSVLIAQPDENIRFPKSAIPPGDYPLCALEPAIIYKNMAGGVGVAKAEARPVLSGWIGYIRDVSDFLSRSQLTRANLRIRARLDRNIRAVIGEAGIEEPSFPAQKHYQALLWAASCLIDRSNTDFLRRYLANRDWPSEGDPADPDSLSHSLFLLLQHAVLTQSDRERLLAAVESAWRRKAIAPFDYARIVDRSSQANRGLQRYGTQISLLDGRKVVEGAAGCRTTLNKRRALLGLDPMPVDVEVRLQDGATCPEP